MNPLSMLCGLAARLTRAIQRAWLRWHIAELTTYLRACERDGLVDSLSLRHWRGQLAALEVRLIALQEPRSTRMAEVRA